MPRQLRHHVPGGWYHIVTRGLGRRTIFCCERDHEHFVELLCGMVERYNIILRAYVLLGNHYHLLIETPEGNASPALQWLNTSYSVWYNVKHDRAGALFQSRFKSIPVDSEGAWAFYCAMYIHLNPVRIKALGLGKEDRKRDKAGMLPKEPDADLVLKRLETLRKYRWSSYPAYAGYVDVPEWLNCEELWLRGCDKGSDPRKEYRKWIEDYIKQGVEEKRFSQMAAAVVIGSTAFIAKVRKRILKDSGTASNRKLWKRLLPFEEVVKAVEAVKGEEWVEFRERKGDSGRDIVCSAARSCCGLTLRELGENAGMSVDAVSKAITRINRRMEVDKKLKKFYNSVLSTLDEIET